MTAQPQTLTFEDTPRPGLFRLVTRIMPKHKFGPGITVPASETLSGHEQREWRCLNCKAIRITVLPEGRREWRIAGEAVQLPDVLRPECGEV